MEEKWRVVLYKNQQGESVVAHFILSLELKAQAKIRGAIHLLKMFGVHATSPNIKKLTGTKLWEIRILGEDSIRILYVAISGKTFLLLHGFKKKTNKTPPREIQIAENRLVEFLERT